jgi:hypothetical protein
VPKIFYVYNARAAQRNPDSEVTISILRSFIYVTKLDSTNIPNTGKINISNATDPQIFLLRILLYILGVAFIDGGPNKRFSPRVWEDIAA